jgi:hypothetical protein
VISLALKSLRQRLGLSLVCIFACALAVASLGASLGVGDALESELARLARARRGQATDVLLFSRPLSATVQARAAEFPGRAAAVRGRRAGLSYRRSPASGPRRPRLIGFWRFLR